MHPGVEGFLNWEEIQTVLLTGLTFLKNECYLSPQAGRHFHRQLYKGHTYFSHLSSGF